MIYAFKQNNILLYHTKDNIYFYYLKRKIRFYNQNLNFRFMFYIKYKRWINMVLNVILYCHNKITLYFYYDNWFVIIVKVNIIKYSVIL